jgi:hypothetical protein
LWRSEAVETAGWLPLGTGLSWALECSGIRGVGCTTLCMLKNLCH